MNKLIYRSKLKSNLRCGADRVKGSDVSEVCVDDNLDLEHSFLCSTLLLQAWRAEGLPLSTSSDQACKLYDAIVTQVCGAD